MMRTLTLGLLLLAGAAHAESYELTLRGHRFQPEELRVPADTAFTIAVKNEDPSPEEFESGALGVEKVIPGGRSLQIRIRPLAPGRYQFIGEYNSETAKGVVIVGSGG